MDDNGFSRDGNMGRRPYKVTSFPKPKVVAQEREFDETEHAGGIGVFFAVGGEERSLAQPIAEFVQLDLRHMGSACA